MSKKRVVLSIMPFWTSILPPTGISALKTYLQKQGHNVFTMDLSSKFDVLKHYYQYFDCIKEVVPENNWGNFFNIGHDLINAQIMGHFNHKSEEDYINLIKLLVENTYACKIEEGTIKRMINEVESLLIVLKKYILFQLQFEEPDYFGLTVYNHNMALSIYALKVIKEYDPEIVTVIGGGAFTDSHAITSKNFETLLEITEGVLNKVVVGQGEKLLSQIINGGKSSEKRVLTNSDIEGEMLGIDETGDYDFEDFNMIKYGFLPATTSRSCLYHCTFCNEVAFYGKYQKKNIKIAVDQMERYYNEYGKQTFFMTDALLNPNIDALSSEIFNRGLSLYYDSYFRIDKKSCNIENTINWRKGGLYRVRLGIESGSQKILEAMNKKLDRNIVRDALYALSYAGIKTTTYWVIGHPGETEEDFQETLKLIEENKSYIYEAECNIFRYHETNQSNTGAWRENRHNLYPDWANDMIKFTAYTLDLYPTLDVGIDRMFRFVKFCEDLGIPNPYSTRQIYDADARWQKYHPNAVPAMVDFDKGKITENLFIKNVVTAKRRMVSEAELDF